METAYRARNQDEFDTVAKYLEQANRSQENIIDWEDIADGFYKLFQHYEQISLEDGSRVFRELKDNYVPSKKEAEEALFSYAVEGEDLETAIESNTQYKSFE